MEENSPGGPGNDGAAGASGGLGDVDMDKDRAKMEAEAAAAEGAFTSMETGTDGDDGKKVGAIKHSKAGMVADDGMKEDGAEAVPEGVKGAAAHAPAAEGVPQPVPNALPPNAGGEMEGWTFAPRKEWNENRTRAACMVWNATQHEAITFVTDLLNGATNDTIRVLPNADKGNGRTHRVRHADRKTEQQTRIGHNGVGAGGTGCDPGAMARPRIPRRRG